MKNVVTEVVNNDLCVGCGICAAVCPTESLKIKLNNKGTYEPLLIDNSCENEGECLNVCPFNPFPKEEVKTEDEIVNKINIQDNSYKHSKAFGRYYSLNVGYAQHYREKASSGGIATWLLKNLIDDNTVDAIIATVEDHTSQKHFKYTIIERSEDLDLTSKTKYYPIEISKVLKEIKSRQKRYAVIGLPCTIKAIRLAQIQKPKDWENIKFTISIFCGGLKSSFFTEYLASKVDVAYNEIKKPQYRVKNIESTAGNYSFSCIKKGETEPRLLPMKSVGDMWGTGYFKPNACDFCEDLSGELADISLGDAWIPPYNSDGRGHSLIISRTKQAEKIIAEGIANNQLFCTGITQRQAFLSQEGNYNHRRIGLSYRLKWERKKGNIIPPKRTEEIVFINPLKAKIFKLRQKIQKESTLFWMEERDRKGLYFEEKIANTKKELMFTTKLEHLFRKKYWLRKLRRK